MNGNYAWHSGNTEGTHFMKEAFLFIQYSVCQGFIDIQ